MSFKDVLVRRAFSSNRTSELWQYHLYSRGRSDVGEVLTTLKNHVQSDPETVEKLRMDTVCPLIKKMHLYIA